MKQTGTAILLGTLCVASFGCSENRSTSTRSEPASDGTVTVTANKPVSLDEPRSTTTVEVDGDNGTAKVARTNTGVNVRDRDNASKTPFDQNENKTDIKITADIRSRVVDTEMSVDAQNVKIITENGKVTLRGPVHNADEKQRIEEIARSVAGSDNVNSQLEIADK